MPRPHSLKNKNNYSAECRHYHSQVSGRHQASGTSSPHANIRIGRCYDSKARSTSSKVISIGWLTTPTAEHTICKTESKNNKTKSSN